MCTHKQRNLRTTHNIINYFLNSCKHLASYCFSANKHDSSHNPSTSQLLYTFMPIVDEFITVTTLFFSPFYTFLLVWDEFLTITALFFSPFYIFLLVWDEFFTITTLFSSPSYIFLLVWDEFLTVTTLFFSPFYTFELDKAELVIMKHLSNIENYVN